MTNPENEYARQNVSTNPDESGEWDKNSLQVEMKTLIMPLWNSENQKALRHEQKNNEVCFWMNALSR